MARLPLVSPLDRVLFLSAQPYLEGVPSNVLTALATYTEDRFYRAGSVIREEAAPIERIIFLGQGSGEVAESDEPTESFRTIDAPGAIGLAHHFAGTHRPPTVRAKSDALCLEIATDDLDQILEDHFPLLLRMAQTTCNHVALTIKTLSGRRPPSAGFEKAAHANTPTQLDLVARLARLKQVPFLAGVNLGVLGEFARFVPPKTIPAGELLWREGDAIDRMVVVLDGQFRSVGRFGSVPAPSGSVIGAWEIFLDEPRFEGWVAEVPSRVVSIGRALFIDVLEDHFEFARSYLGRASSHLIAGWKEFAKGRAEADSGSSPTPPFERGLIL